MFPVEDLPYFCVKIRLEGKDGLKRFRIPYNPVHDSYEILLDAILERYLPEDDKPFIESDYVVKLREIGDAEWPIDIENTKDIALAINSTPAAKTEGHIKMAAYIRLASEPEPPVAMCEQDEKAAANISTSAAVGEYATAAAPNAAPTAKRMLISPAKASPPKRRKTGKSTSSAVGGSKGNKLSVRARIIGSIAELHALGKQNPPRIHVAIFAGYSNAASKGFANPLSMLKTEGMIAYPDKNSVALTAEGLASKEAKAITPPTNNAEVHSRIKALLSPKQQQIFDLLAKDGSVYPRDEVAAAVGYSNPSSKGWSNSIGKMSSLGLSHYPKDDADPKKKLIQLTDMCFPFSNQHQPTVDDGTYRATTPPLEAPISFPAAGYAGAPICFSAGGFASAPVSYPVAGFVGGADGYNGGINISAEQRVEYSTTPHISAEYSTALPISAEQRIKYSATPPKNFESL